MSLAEEEMMSLIQNLLLDDPVNCAPNDLISSFTLTPDRPDNLHLCDKTQEGQHQPNPSADVYIPHFQQEQGQNGLDFLPQKNTLLDSDLDNFLLNSGIDNSTQNGLLYKPDQKEHKSLNNNANELNGSLPSHGLHHLLDNKLSTDPIWNTNDLLSPLSDCSINSLRSSSNSLTKKLSSNSTSSYDSLLRNDKSSIHSCIGKSNGTSFLDSDNFSALSYSSRPGTVSSLYNSSSSSSSLADSSLFQEDKFESQLQKIANEIHSTIQLHMNGLQTRRDQLLQQLENVKRIYVEMYKTSGLNSSLPNDTESRRLYSRGNSDNNVNSVLLPTVTFTKPDSTLFKAVSSLGFLTTPAFAPFCSATGDGLELAVPGVNTNFTIVTRNCFNEDLLIGRENIVVKIVACFNSNVTENESNSSCFVQNGNKSESKTNLEYNSTANFSSTSFLSQTIIPYTLLDHNNGKYIVTYMIPVSRNPPNEVKISIMVNGVVLNDSPFHVPVQLDLRQRWTKSLSFGSEGNAIGQLCRPWGVAIVRMPQQLLAQPKQSQQQSSPPLLEDTCSQFSCFSSASNEPTSHVSSSTKHYLIAIADRSNNRIQLLDFNSSSLSISVLQVFGSGPSTRAGLFDRPAGITINTNLNHIIVADKDNHRIQVFDLRGRYLFKFGEKGNRVGQFCYPWDVDSCPLSHQIAVSDTRNRRVQLFTPYGQYITHFAHPLDSPRGVCFLGDKKIVVSDFNKHRLIVFDKFGCKEEMNKIIGFGEGNGWGEFLRPQGISISGNSIFCTDSRNNRICIYNLFTQSFEYLSDDLNCDRPSGLDVIDNVLVVVDFGNNRLLLCQR